MQYAALEINGQRVLIDSKEYYELNKKQNIVAVPHDEKSGDYKIVYGSYLFQSGIDKKVALEHMSAAKGSALGLIDQQQCRLSELCDIVSYETDNPIKIPFAALMRTSEEITNKNKRALSFFLRYSNLKPIQNLFNRPGIFAVMDQEKRLKGSVTASNWRTFVDEERALRSASKVI